MKICSIMLCVILLKFNIIFAEPIQSQSDTNSWTQYHNSSSHYGTTYSHLTTPLETQWEVYMTGQGDKPVSPVVYKDTVYLGVNLMTVPGSYTYFHAYDIITGDLKWKYKTEGPYISTTSAVSEDKDRNVVVIFGDASYVYCIIDQEDKAQPKWKFNTGQSSLVSAITVKDDSVFFMTSRSDNGYITLYCINFETGELKWSFSNNNNLQDTYASIAVDSNNNCYLFAEYIPESADYLYILDKDGNLNAEVFIAPHAGTIYSSPLVYNEMVFVGTRNGKVCAIDTKTHNIAWTWYNPFDISISSSPVLNPDLGLLYIADDKYTLHAIYIDDGMRKWTKSIFSTDGVNTASASISLQDNVMLMAFPEADIGSDNYRDWMLCELDPENGSIHWNETITSYGWAIESSPAIAGDAVYIAEDSGNLKKLQNSQIAPVQEKSYVSMGNEIRSNYPNTIYSDNTYAYVGTYHDGGVRKYLVYADLSNIPANAKITAARLEFDDYSSTWNDDINFAIYEIQEKWTSDVSWDTTPEISTGPISIGKKLDYFYVFDCTQLVQDWVSNTKTNYGLIVSKEYESQSAGYAMFYGDDYSSNTHKPRFAIWYYVPGEFSDTIAPNVKIISPDKSEIVSGKINIKAEATDYIGIEKVEFYIDNSLAGEDSTFPYEYDWGTGTISSSISSIEIKKLITQNSLMNNMEEEHTIKVIAYDTSGNQASDEISVKVKTPIRKISSSPAT